MTKEIEFFVEGSPKGQPRPRAFSRGNKAGVYDPGSANEWKFTIAETAKKHRPEKPWQGPVKLRLEFVLKRPKSHYRTGKNSNQLKPGAPLYHTGKPDVDNLYKSTSDALTLLGFWNDDSQIAHTMIRKSYTDDRQGCFVRITELVV